MFFHTKGPQGQQQSVGVRVPTHQEVRVRWCGCDRVRQVPRLEEGGRDPARLAVQTAGCVRGMYIRALLLLRTTLVTWHISPLL